MDLVMGRLPSNILIIEAPPRHGKSEFISKYVPAWYLSTWPDRRVIITSYGADLARSWGRKSREIVESPEFQEHCPGVFVSDQQSAAADWEIDGTGGGVITAGVRGPITGRGAHFLIVDDFAKNSEEAASPKIQESNWDWWQSTAVTRLEPEGCAVVMGTRWDENDLIGKLLRAADEGEIDPVTRIRLPALAEDGDLLGRMPGEALWPDRWPLDKLLRRQQQLGGPNGHWWNALFQQRPTARSGGMFKESHFSSVPKQRIPKSDQFDELCRYWDKAGTEGGGDYTVGVLMGRMGSQYYVLDVVRGQWSHGRREQMIDLTASLDFTDFGNKVMTRFEKEPGSGGSAEQSAERLTGYRMSIESSREKGNKLHAAEPLAIEAENHGIILVQAPWNRDFVREHVAFDHGEHDDQVDATSGAYRYLSRKRKKLLVANSSVPDPKTSFNSQCKTTSCKRLVEPGTEYCCAGCRETGDPDAAPHSPTCCTRWNDHYVKTMG